MGGLGLLLALLALGGPSAAQPAWSAEECYRRQVASREHQALKAKLPPMEPGSLPSLAQQADPTKATAEEAAMIRSLHQNYIVPCRQGALRSPTNADPAVLVVLAESFAKSDASYLALIERKITWGEFNRQVAALRTETRARLLQIMQPGGRR
jgi:hypothetical protein